MPPSVRALEWRLLFATLTGQPPACDDAACTAAAPDELEAAAGAVELIEQGRYQDVLALPMAAAMLPSPPPYEAPSGADAEAAALAAATAASQHYAAVRASLAARRLAPGAPGAAARALEALLVGAAALLLALQANVTGPEPAGLPACPGATQQAAAPDAHRAWDAWAIHDLSVGGEEVVGKAVLPQYLVLARILLVDEELAAAPLPELDGTTVVLADVVDGDDAIAALARARAGGLLTSSWWAARAALLQQRLLARAAASQRATLVALHARALALHASSDAAPGDGSAADGRSLRRVAAAAHLEAALMEFEYRRPDDAAPRLAACCAALRLRHEVVGALGTRTVHQQAATAQMVLTWHVDPDADAAEAGEPLPPLPGDAGGDASADPDASEPDVLPAPRLDAALARAPLPALEQAALLAEALGVRKGRAADELRAWDMAPYVDAVREQRSGAPTLRAAADLLAVRHEVTRGRTRERAMGNMQSLTEALSAPLPPPHARARLAFATWLPAAPVLRREMGEQLLAVGAVGAAMAVFEALELWDPLIACLQLAGKRAEAGALVRRLLEASPRDARLWCALGDATGDENHYRTAWEASEHRSARSQRSLARGASGRQDWPGCAAAWELALAINPLHAEGWFGLGYASMQTGDDTRALVAFSRVTAQEAENGEAWNNVAALSLRAGRSAAALSALLECVKHKRDAWQVWDNLATVAARCSAWAQAATACSQLLRLTAGKRCPDEEALASLVDAAAEAPPAALLRTQVGDVLIAAAAGGANTPRFWALSAAHRAAQGDATGAAECAARRMRAAQDAAWDRDAEAFEAYADACVALAEAHAASGGVRDLAAVRMQLRGALKRSAERFGDAGGHARMATALEAVTAREDALRAAEAAQ